MIKKYEAPEPLPCPFCGGEARIQREYRDNGYSGEKMTYFICRCGVKGSSRLLKTMASFTEYTVKDFRDNPVLRAKEEDRYEQYCTSVDVQALTAWNTRTAIQGGNDV